MPVDALFLDQNEDFGHSDNWTPSVPVTGDSIFIPKLTLNVNDGLDAFASVNPVKVVLGTGIVGSLGSRASPAQFGSVGTLDAMCPNAASIGIDTAACTLAQIRATPIPTGGAGFSLLGTQTTIAVGSSGGIYLKNAATSLFVSSPARLEIDVDAAIATIISRAAEVLLYAAIATRYVQLSGRTIFAGDGAKTIALLEMHAGTFDWRRTNSTITLAQMFGGTLHGFGGTGRRTLTNANVWPGATLDMRGDLMDAANLPANFGGNVYGVESTQVIQPWTGGAQGL